MMLDELEKNIQADLDKDFPGVSKLKANFAGKIPPSQVATVAEQLLAVAESIKSITKDIDALEEEFRDRLNDLRKRLGSKG
jgi:hypothetical protein